MGREREGVSTRVQEPTATVKRPPLLAVSGCCSRTASKSLENRLLPIAPLLWQWQVSVTAIAVLEKSTSRFELCLQHGAAEIRAFKSQTTARKRVSSLPDAAVITFESSTFFQFVMVFIVNSRSGTVRVTFEGVSPLHDVARPVYKAKNRKVRPFYILITNEG